MDHGSFAPRGFCGSPVRVKPRTREDPRRLARLRPYGRLLGSYFFFRLTPINVEKPELGLTAEVPALWISRILGVNMNPIGRLQVDTKAVSYCWRRDRDSNPC